MSKTAPSGQVYRCRTCHEFSKWSDTVSYPNMDHEHDLELVDVIIAANEWGEHDV